MRREDRQKQEHAHAHQGEKPAARNPRDQVSPQQQRGAGTPHDTLPHREEHVHGKLPLPD